MSRIPNTGSTRLRLLALVGLLAAAFVALPRPVEARSYRCTNQCINQFFDCDGNCGIDPDCTDRCYSLLEQCLLECGPGN